MARGPLRMNVGNVPWTCLPDVTFHRRIDGSRIPRGLRASACWSTCSLELESRATCAEIQLQSTGGKSLSLQWHMSHALVVDAALRRCAWQIRWHCLSSRIVELNPQARRPEVASLPLHCGKVVLLTTHDLDDPKPGVFVRNREQQCT